MATRREIADQIAKLQKDLDSAPDDELELLVERNGVRTTLRGQHAQKLLRQFGLDDEPEGGDQDGGGDQDDDGAKKADPPPPAGHKFFS